MTYFEKYRKEILNISEKISNTPKKLTQYSQIEPFIELIDLMQDFSEYSAIKCNRCSIIDCNCENCLIELLNNEV